tara:strand:- start:544 stop:2028 length:1485 start_codon:yes stop_codon:yes gene_type:complete
MGIFDRFTGSSPESTELLKEIRDLSQDNRILSESYSALARATLEFDEKGWAPLNQFTDTGMELADVKVVSQQARRQTASNPILKRGSTLRASYVFGRGFKMSQAGNPLAPRFQKIIDDPINQQVLFSGAACKKNEKSLFTDGNFFVRFDRRNRKFSRVPLDEIAGWATDPDDPEIVRYYLREYQVREPVTDPYNTYQAKTVKVWYPVDYVNSPVSQINGITVDRNMAIIDTKANDETGSLWGLPDALPALPWSWAYSEYLKDGSKMLKALSSIAWQVKSKTAKGGVNISSKLVSNKEVAATAVTGADIEMNAMPRNNSVDLATGEPLAAMAATAMEVSVDALLAGSGSTGGGGSQILDQSTLNAAYARQGNWEDFFMRVLRLIGVPEPTVTFNNIIVDPAYRTIQSLSQAWMTGLFSAEIMQDAMAEQLGIEAPGFVPSGVLIPNNEDSFANTGTTLGAGNPNNVASSQGNSGAGVDDLSNGDNGNRDTQNNPR